MTGKRSTSILLATGNPAKQQKLAWLVEGLGLSTTTPQQLGLTGVPEEEGGTHHEIARDKAREWSLAGSTLAIASDGGLVLPALGDNWQSIHTHRFAGPAADDQDRTRRLLESMEPYHGEEREATWVEGICIADRGRILASWELRGGTGVIAESPSDTPAIPGFWAFSVWHFPQFGRTYNQLNQKELESLDDHWTSLRRLLRRYFQTHFVSHGR
jgi:inosine/xanthosine triphosphate pyrophosphatase family protein